jgi:hypothetical protein
MTGLGITLYAAQAPRVKPNPTRVEGLSAISVDGETGSRGRSSTQLALMPPGYQISLLGKCSVAFQGLFHCPRL